MKEPALEKEMYPPFTRTSCREESSYRSHSPWNSVGKWHSGDIEGANSEVEKEKEEYFTILDSICCGEGNVSLSYPGPPATRRPQGEATLLGTRSGSGTRATLRVLTLEGRKKWRIFHYFRFYLL